jgi:GDP-D-mannose dehydratase
VKLLLEKGYTIHATVRNPGKWSASWLVKLLLDFAHA